MKGLPMPQDAPAMTPIAFEECQRAKSINMSAHWLRKDRATARIIPFHKLGSAVRYSPERVREALAAREEGRYQVSAVCLRGQRRCA